MRRTLGAVGVGALVCGALAFAAGGLNGVRMGKQPDGSFIVSSGQRVEPGAIAFDGRPIDLALHPAGELLAVLNQRSVFLATRGGVVTGSTVALADGAGYRGAVWTPDGTRLLASVSNGTIQELTLSGRTLREGRRLVPQPPEASGNPRPGGMAVTRDGTRLFVAAADRNAVAEIDLTAFRWLREWKVQNLPFEVKLSQDEQTLIVSNWGGREPAEEDEKA
jgi:DNA-binding beta-propeller fold protein YncE